jgi:hypothetical protein
VHHDIDGAYAYVIINNEDGNSVALKRPLKKGLQFGEWTEIISGIEIGENIIVKGFLGLRDKKPVTLVDKTISKTTSSAPDNSQPENIAP